MKVNRQNIIVGVALAMAIYFLVSKQFMTRRHPSTDDTDTFEVAPPPAPAVVSRQEKDPVEPERFKESAAFPKADPVQEKKEKSPGPGWFGKLLSLHEKYYPSWQSGDNVTASVPPSTGTSGKSSQAGAVSGMAPQVSASSPSASLPAGNIVTPDAVRAASSSTASETPLDKVALASSGGGGPIIDNGGDQEDNEEPQQTPVTITRSVTSAGGTVDVTLNIGVTADISGLVIIETVPAGYTIESATPKYAKKTGNTYRWLIYGKSIPSQRIDYRLSGSGGGPINGSYRSTRSSGNIGGTGAL